MNGEPRSARERRRSVVGALVAVLLFAVALRALQLLAREYDWSDIRVAFGELPRERVLSAIALTIGSFSILTLYDVLALRYVRRKISYRRSSFVSIVGFSLGNSVSPGVLSGGAVRYRMYSALGLDGLDIAKIVTFCSVMTGMGVTVFGGLGLTLSPQLLASGLKVHEGLILAAGLLMFVPAASLLASSLMHKSVWRWGAREFQLPSPGIALGQVLAPLADDMLAGGVLYVLLPPGSMSYLEFAGLYSAAVGLGFVSHVPGGLGVFESMIVVLTASRVPGDEALAALLGYRVIYYFVPLAIGLILLSGYEFVGRGAAPQIK